MSQYLFIVISQYRVQKCLVCIAPNVDEIDTWTIPSDDVKAFILSVISDNI